MAKRKTKPVEVETYRHSNSTRKNIPPAKIAGVGEIPEIQKAKYGYSAHLSPEVARRAAPPLHMLEAD